jgi:hypothetical protein
MKLTRIVAVALAALLVSTGAAVAQPANASDGDQGPPSDLPDPVPDFVGDVLGSVTDFVNGEIAEPLGDTVSDLTPGGDGDAAENASNA